MAALLCFSDAFNSTPSQWKAWMPQAARAHWFQNRFQYSQMYFHLRLFFLPCISKIWPLKSPEDLPHQRESGLESYSVQVDMKRGALLAHVQQKEELLICKEMCYFLITLVISLYLEVKHQFWVHYFLITNMTLDHKILNSLKWKADQWAAQEVFFVCLVFPAERSQDADRNPLISYSIASFSTVGKQCSTAQWAWALEIQDWVESQFLPPTSYVSLHAFDFSDHQFTDL